MNGEFRNKVLNIFFIVENQEYLAFIIPFILTAYISENFIVKLSVDATFIVFSLINLILDFYFLKYNNITDLSIKNNLSGSNNQTNIQVENIDSPENYVFHYDLLILLIFGFLHFLFILRNKEKLDKMTIFIKNKTKTENKFVNEKKNSHSIEFIKHEVLDINNYLIYNDMKNKILKNIYDNYFKNIFTILEYTCMTSFCKLKYLGKK